MSRNSGHFHSFAGSRRWQSIQGFHLVSQFFMDFGSRNKRMSGIL